MKIKNTIADSGICGQEIVFKKIHDLIAEKPHSPRRHFKIIGI